MTENKKRKPNWKDAEVGKLLTLVAPRYNRLIGRFSSQLTLLDKKKEWDDIALQFDDRNGEECKVKFIQLKSRAISEYSQYKKEQMKTGGSFKPPRLSDDMMQLINIVGRQS